MAAMIHALAALLVLCGQGHGHPHRHHHGHHGGPVLVRCRINVGCTVQPIHGPGRWRP